MVWGPLSYGGGLVTAPALLLPALNNFDDLLNNVVVIISGCRLWLCLVAHLLPFRPLGAHRIDLPQGKYTLLRRRRLYVKILILLCEYG